MDASLAAPMDAPWRRHPSVKRNGSLDRPACSMHRAKSSVMEQHLSPGEGRSSAATAAGTSNAPSMAALRVVVLAALLPRASGGFYTACVPLRYGPDCSGECACAEHEDCDDGVTGTGECTCGFGSEALCGIPSRLVPPPAAAPPCPTHTGCHIDDVVLTPVASRRLWLDRATRRAPRRIANATLVPVLPTPLRAASLRLVASDPRVAALLGLDHSSWLDDARDFTELFSGRRLFPGSVPYSHVYGGHQFGSWSGQLGDGRAISLGDLGGYEISLKGSGRTPLSRAGDGRAVLQSVCREFLGGAALVALGVPSARALAVVGTDDPRDAIVRDEWYTGQATRKPAGVLVRVAPTFLRFGSFQLAAKRQGVAGVLELATFALERIAGMEARDDDSAAYLHRAQLYGGAESVHPDTRAQCFFSARKQPSCAASATAAVGSDPDAAAPERLLRCLLRRVVRRSAALVAAWTAAGFAHGVMNTDNMSILGISLDLNVYGFLERYSEGFVPNKIDDEGRYAFGQQAEMMRWNLARLASALGGTSYPQDYEPDARSWSKAGQLKGDDAGGGGGWLSLNARTAELNGFDHVFEHCLEVRRRLKLGLNPHPAADNSGEERGQEAEVVEAWILWLHGSGADMGRAFRGLATLPLEAWPRDLADAADGKGAAAKKEEEEEEVVVAATAAAAAAAQKAAALVAVEHVAAYAGVSAQWVDDNQAQSVRAVGGLIAAVAHGLRSSSAGDHGSLPDRDEQLLLWRKHVAAVNPAVVLRTAALRELTTFAAEDSEHGCAALQAMLEHAKNPYTVPSEPDPSAGDTCISGDPAGGEDDAMCDRGMWVAAKLVARVVGEMRGLPKGAASDAPPQTSCGGQ
jgi:uncharacterized protein YdiU (UPF0061 family)